MMSVEVHREIKTQIKDIMRNYSAHTVFKYGDKILSTNGYLVVY